MAFPFETELANFSRVAMPLILDAGAKSLLILPIAALVVFSLRRASAATRHLVWFISVVSLVLLPLLTAILPAWHVLPHWTTQSSASPTDLKGVPSTDSAKVTSNARLMPARLVSLSERGLPTEAAPAKRSGPIRLGHYGNPRSLLLLLWAAGALCCLIPTLMGMISLWCLKRVSKPLTESDWSKLLEESLSLLKCRGPVVLFKSQRRRMPMTWGFVRPILLLPEEAENWSAERRRMVLLHELAHVKRWDFLMKIVSQVIAAAYWFNPIAWVALRRMAIEREQACDDLVLSCGAKPTEYATELLQIASGRPATEFMTFGAIAIAHKSKLERRVVAILDAKRDRRSVSARTKGAALILLMLALFPLALLRGALPRSNETQGGTRHFVRLVLGDGKLTFEGNDVTWKTLGERLGELENRAHTVLEFAVSSEDLTLAQFNEAQARANELSKRFGFEHFSYVGVQPVGSKGSPSTPPLESKSPQKGSPSSETLDEDLKRISEIQQLLLLLRPAEDNLKRATDLYKDHIIPDNAFKRAEREVELLKAEIQRKDGSVRQVQAHIAIGQAEDDFRRAAELFKEHIISEGLYNQSKEKLELAKAEASADPREAENAKQLRTVKYEFRQAQDDFRRAADLFKEHIIPQSTFEAAKQKVDSVELQIASLEASQTNAPDKQLQEVRLRIAQSGLKALEAARKDGLVTIEDYERAKRTVEHLSEKLKEIEAGR